MPYRSSEPGKPSAEQSPASSILAIDRRLRVLRWRDAVDAIDATPGAAADISLRQRRRMALAMLGRIDDALADAEWIAAQPEATPEDLQHLAHLRLRNLLPAQAFAAAARALERSPALTRAQAVAVAAAALLPTLRADAERLLCADAATPPPSSPKQEAADNGMLRAAIPWRLPPYAAYSGAHPIVVSALGPGAILQPCWPPPDAKADPALALNATPRLAAWFAEQPDDSARRALVDFLVHRLPLLFYPQPDGHLTLHHTVPFIPDGRPWALHMEQLNVLHAPMVSFPHAVIDPQAAWVGLLARLFATPDCLGIVTHIRQTAALLRRLFPQPNVAEKIAYIPFGIDVAKPAVRRAKRPIGAPALRRATTTLLFTNSHGRDNFLVRGGVDVLNAAIDLYSRRPNLRLIVRSPPPDMPTPAPWRLCPGITWMTERLTESEIDDLYAEADVFLLPSALLHAVSLTRALRAGLATVASDAFGVNEFIRHHVNGLITPGRRAMVGRGAADAFFSEDCRALLTPSPVPADLAFYHRFRAAVGLLADNPALRRRLSGNAARTAARSHDGRRWAAQLTGWVKARYLGSRNEDASRAT